MDQLDWENLLAECVRFTQDVVRIPSMSGEEDRLASRVAEELHRLDFSQVWIDSMGNVGGRIKGLDQSLGALVFNSHLDHVDPGELTHWPYPPYSAEIVQDRIYGRGTCDIKGPMAVQIYSIAAIIRSGFRPLRDIVYSGVVREETGGDGAKYWIEHLDEQVDLVILGEPSSNNLSLGHRGILQLWVTFEGQSAHASAPGRAVNPNYFLAEFIKALSEVQDDLGRHTVLGPTTIAPTIIEVDTSSPNVTPAWVRVLLDVRTATESPYSLRKFVERLAGEHKYQIQDSWSRDNDPTFFDSQDVILGYFTPEGELTGKVRKALATGMGWKPSLTTYQFATDGRHFAPYGIPVLGYSPGEEELAHTVNESISIAMMRDSLYGHFELIKNF